MKHLKSLAALLLCLALLAGFMTGFAADEEMIFGGNGDDLARGMIRLADGGYLIYGSTTSDTGEFTRYGDIGTGQVPWAMRLDQDLVIRMNALLPSQQSGWLSVRGAVELDNGQLALLVDVAEEGYKSDLVIISRYGEVVRSYGLPLKEGSICAIKGGVAVAGCATQEDGSPRLGFARLFSGQEELKLTYANDIAVSRTAAILEQDDSLWALVETREAGDTSNTILLLRQKLQENGFVLDKTTWHHPTADLVGLSLLPGEGRPLVGVSFQPIERRMDDEVEIVNLLHDGDRVGGVASSPIFARSMPYHQHKNIVLMGNKGGRGVGPQLGDEAVAYYYDDVNGTLRTLTQSNSKSGLCFVTGVQVEGAMKVLGMQITDDQGIQVFLADWDFQKGS